jgi:hypothetical protein
VIYKEVFEMRIANPKNMIAISFALFSLLVAAPASGQVVKATVRINGMI